MRSKSILSWFLSICMVLALFAAMPANSWADSPAVGQDWFDTAPAVILLTSGDIYQLSENIVIGQNTEIQTNGEAGIDLNGHKLTLAPGTSLTIGNGVSVTGAVYEADSTALDINGFLSVIGGRIDVSGDSAIGIKINPGGVAMLGSASIQAPGIGVYAAGGDTLAIDRTSIIADGEAGTAVKADAGGNAILLGFDTIQAGVRFDNASGAGNIFNFHELVWVRNEDGSELLDLSSPVVRGTGIILQYSDSTAMDAAGVPVYYTLDGSEPDPEDNSEDSRTKRLDSGNPSDSITVNHNMTIRRMVQMPWTNPNIELSSIEIHTGDTVNGSSDFMEAFNSIKNQGGTIDLTGNLTVETDMVLAASREVVVNTRGYRIIVDGEGSVLTLKGKIRITGDGLDSEQNPGVVAALNGGRLEMLGGAVEAAESDGTAVYISRGGAQIQGGTVRADAAGGTGVFIGEWGRADVSGGTVIADAETGVGVKADGDHAEAVISGGRINAHTPKLKGNTADMNPEKIYDFRGIEISTNPSAGYAGVGTTVTISKRLLSGELDPMDAAGATVYYTTNDSNPSDSGNAGRIELTDGTSTVLIDNHKTINTVALINGGVNGLHSATGWFPYIASDENGIQNDVNTLRNISGYDWAYDAVEQLFRSFIMPEFNASEEWLSGPVTRARLAKLIAIGFKLPYYSSVSSSFDSDEDWNAENRGYVPFIETAKQCFTYPEDTFEPAELVTREQLVYAIIKVLGLNIGSLEAADTANAANKYSKDWNAIEDEYKPCVALATKLGFVSGYNGYFKPKVPVSNAEMSVLLWRALNSSGGAGKGLFSDMKTGDYGYEAVMDLVNRTGDAFEGQTKFNPNGMVDGSTWDAWKAALGVSLVYPGDGTTKRLEAALLLVAELPENSKKGGQVFSDVAPADWCYDGVMNLYNAGIIKGYEDGTFRPDEELTANSLANFVAQQKEIPVIDRQNAANQEDICAYFPGAPADNTREAAAYAILKLLDIDTSAISPETADAILGGFADKNGISAACRPAMAYMVSIGALKGDEGGRLNPEARLFRGQFAVFYSRVLNGLDKSKMKDYMDTIHTAE